MPWEDPAAAVVFGGSPERIHATLVDGEFRYVRGEEREWLEELRSSARAAPADECSAAQRLASPRGRVGDDTLFFYRLRRHAKWMFVLLALVFGLGFVFFGVGSGSSIGDLLQGNLNFGGSSSASISSLQKKVQKNPEDAAAWLKLSQAYQAKGQTDQAVAPLKRYMALRPKDSARSRRSSRCSRRARSTLAQQAYNAQTRPASRSPPTRPAASAPRSRGPGHLRPDRAGRADEGHRPAVDADAQATTAFKEAESSLKKLVAVSPDDTSTLFQYAQIAQYAGDSTTALAGYRKFLKLAPDDPKAAVAKQQIKALAPPPAKNQ